MKSIKEISQNIASLSEGMFDMEGDDRLEKEIAKDSEQMFLKTCKGNFNTVFFKDGSCRINGKLILSGLATDQIYIRCKDFHGKLIIENCNKLTTLQGSFLEKIAVFDGSITINQCPALTSVIGLPSLIKGDLSITNCKKLRSADGIDTVFGNLYWSGNGKKYTPEQLKEKVHIIKKIVCSVEDEDANISEGLVTEAFNNPWLQRLAKQLKKYPFKEYSWDEKEQYNKVDTLFARYGRVSTHIGQVGRLLDKITSEDIDVYDMSNEKDKKDLAKVFWDAYNAGNDAGADIILVYNEDLEEFIGAFGYVCKPRGAQGAGVEWIHIPHKGSYTNKMSEGDWLTKTEAKSELLDYGVGYTIVVINAGKNSKNDSSTRYDIRFQRAKSQEGVINPGDVEQYKKIAAANLKRYKDEVAQIKLARKKSDEAAGYDLVIDRYEQINLRIIKLVRAIAKDPKAFNKYDITSFLEWTRDSQCYNPNYKPWKKDSGSQYYGENGLVYYFKSFMDCYMACFGSGHYKSAPDASDYKYLETAAKNMNNILDIADQKLKKFGF